MSILKKYVTKQFDNTVLVMRIFCISLLLCFSIVVSGQSKKDLQKQIQQTKKDIELANKLLKETEKNKQETYDNLLLLSKKISLRQQYVGHLAQEISRLNSNILAAYSDIKALELEVKKLKDEYARLVYFAYKNRSTYERLMFVLASNDFNQAYKRLRYLQQYSAHRKEQVEQIRDMQDSLVVKIANYNRIIAQKSHVMKEKEEEAVVLTVEKSQQTEIVTALEAKSKDLIAEIENKKQYAEKLKAEIEKIIAAEQAERARKEKEAKANKTKVAKTPQEQIVSAKFGENKGRLPWPTEQGVITETFGEHPHPVLKNIKTVNNGVDITTNKGAAARAIFDGVVSRVIVIPGSNAAILLRHGDYLSVYTNLINVKVKAGDKISTKQLIGTIATDAETGKTTLQLQIWKETLKLNPEDWLSKHK